MSGPLNLQVSKRSRIRGALVCDPFGWGCAMLLQEFADELQGGLLVPLGLNQHLKNLTFTIDGAPEIHLLATNLDEHFVQVPAAVRLRPPRPQPACDCRPEGEHPAPDGLVGYLDPALGQEFLDIAIAEGEAQIEPDRTLNDVARKAVAGVAR